MITMEFDELQKIWDSQNNEPLYVINEKALHNRIQSKMNSALHITNASELLLIIINLGAGSILLGMNPFKAGANIFMYLATAWMYGTALYLLVSRIRRIKAGRQFDRSMHGDLNHAISLATYQVRLSRIVRLNILPMGALMILSGWEAGKFFKVTVVILISYALAFYVGRREHNLYKRRKRELQALKEKLDTGN